jgi:protocatechuate 3,4-dioxygenase beta subunit
MRHLTNFWLTALLFSIVLGCVAAEDRSSGEPREPIIGGPCEGCEAVFEGLPDELSSRSRIAPPDEPGERMRIEGTVADRDGRPAPGVIVYAYHTDAEGIYPKEEDRRGQASYRHGRLRGWARTDAQGHYRFDTIRPASYPGNEVPAHVHLHVIEPGCCTYYIDSIHFADDPLLSPADRREMASGRGGGGLVSPRRDEDGTWIVERDITLGEGVPGYGGS